MLFIDSSRVTYLNLKLYCGNYVLEIVNSVFITLYYAADICNFCTRSDFYIPNDQHENEHNCSF